MKQILTSIMLLFVITTYSQQITYKQWEEEALTNIRLLPKYGYKPKTEEQKKADQAFIEETIKNEKINGDRTAASNQMINFGISYLYKGDVKTAMYRFNQAYLLDSLNTDIYCGYGAVYITLGQHEKALQQYKEGLSISPKNARLLAEYGAYFMALFYNFQSSDTKLALKHLDSAITYLHHSYKLHPTESKTTFRLSVCNWIKGDCKNAWKYYDECKILGGQPITEEYTNDLKKVCSR